MRGIYVPLVRGFCRATSQPIDKGDQGFRATSGLLPIVDFTIVTLVLPTIGILEMVYFYVEFSST